MSDDGWDLDKEIRYKVIRGDAYPSIMKMWENQLKGKGGSRVSGMSDMNVNISGAIDATKGGWIGMRLYVMAPCQKTANVIFPAIADLLAKFGYVALPKALMEHLEGAIKGTNGDLSEIREFWPDEAGPLRRK